MKILINESRSEKLIQNILNRNGIKMEFVYGGKIYDSSYRIYHSVEVWFKIPNEYREKLRTIHFITRKNKVVDIDSYGDFSTVIPEFKHIPKKMVVDYFIKGAKEHLEEMLPNEFPNDGL